MEVFVITESYQDYKGADATTHGVYKTYEDALKGLKDILEDVFAHVFENLDVDEYGEDDWIEAHFYEKKDNCAKWHYEDGDSEVVYYIDKIEADI